MFSRLTQLTIIIFHIRTFLFTFERGTGKLPIGGETMRLFMLLSLFSLVNRCELFVNHSRQIFRWRRYDWSNSSSLVFHYTGAVAWRCRLMRLTWALHVNDRTHDRIHYDNKSIQIPQVLLMKPPLHFLLSKKASDPKIHSSSLSSRKTQKKHDVIISISCRK